jgi:hypothetical protein
VGIDRSDDADVPEEHSDHSADRADAAGDARQPADFPTETRNRQECYDDLRAADAAKEKERTEPEPRSKTEERARNGEQAPEGTNWGEKAELSRRMWGEYLRRWPPEERAPVDRSADPPGSWRGEGGRFLDKADNDRIEAECDRIVDREQEKILPALRDIENQDPDRRLIGLEHHLKRRDRIKEKVYDNMNALHCSADAGVSLVPDAIRYTFQYEGTRYRQGVFADIGRLEDQGFRLEKLKNYWSDDKYKGINSQWIDPDTGQRFELQFHTRISFEAKQLTHDAYGRLRTGQPDEFEQMVLEAFEKKVTAEVPVPHGSVDIPDYPKRETDAR